LIVVLSQESIVDIGTYQQLLSRCDYYRELYYSNFLNECNEKDALQGIYFPTKKQKINLIIFRFQQLRIYGIIRKAIVRENSRVGRHVPLYMQKGGDADNSV
jgi:hypothetical protein